MAQGLLHDIAVSLFALFAPTLCVLTQEQFVDIYHHSLLIPG